MTDTGVTTPAKPGWKTTEYWLTKAAMILGVLLASGLLGDGSTGQRIAGAAATVLAQFGYTMGRSLVKSGAAP